MSGIDRFVVGFAFNETETALALLVKARPSWQRGYLNGVGGHVENGETALEAMEREWQEEINDVEVSWRQFARLSGTGFEVSFFRTSAPLEGIHSTSDGEPVVVVDPDDLPSNTVPNLTWLVPMARMKNRHDWPFDIRESATV